MSIKKELEQYRQMGVAEEDMEVQAVDGEEVVTLTIQGTKTLLRTAADAGDKQARAILDWAANEEALLLEQGKAPAEAAAEGLSDAMEAIAGVPTVDADQGGDGHAQFGG